MTIIHINGSPGSGKTTIINKLKTKKNIVAIDLDDIDDKNAMKLLNDKKNDHMFINLKATIKFWKAKAKLNKESLKKIMKENSDKVLVFAGLSIDIPNVDYGFVMKIDAGKNYKQLSSRTLTDICKNSKQLKKLVTSEIVQNKQFLIMLFKYKIRVYFPMWIIDIEKKISSKIQYAKNNNYKYIPSKEIYKQIIKIAK